MKINNDIFNNILNMVKLSCTEEEKKQLIKDLNQLVGFIDTMSELNTDNVEPMTYIHSTRNVYREDIVNDSKEDHDIHANALEIKDGYYVVPRILE